MARASEMGVLYHAKPGLESAQPQGMTDVLKS